MLNFIGLPVVEDHFVKLVRLSQVVSHLSEGSYCIRAFLVFLYQHAELHIGTESEVNRFRVGREAVCRDLRDCFVLALGISVIVAGVRLQRD